MSTTASGATNEWLVHIPDYPDVLEKRLEVRPSHIGDLKPDLQSGKIVFGGATLKKQPTEKDETLSMSGSVMLIKANTEEEVVERIKADAYTKGGVFDVSKMTIWPFRCAVRLPM